MQQDPPIIDTDDTDENDERDLADERSTMVATSEATGEGIEFHVSMRRYTMADMETLIVEAAARQIVGRNSDNTMAKAIEARCIELVAQKADAKLATITTEIIDQPLIPAFTYAKAPEPVTMREFIGLTGREYLTQRVDSVGKPSTSSYDKTRIERLVGHYMDVKYKNEIEKATNAAIGGVRAAIKASHDALLAAETARFREALAKTAGAA